MAAPRRTLVFALAGIILIAAAAVLGRRPAVAGFPVFGYGAALLLILGFGLLAPAFAQLLLGLLSPLLKSAAPILGRLAAQSMRANLGRIVTAVNSGD